MLANHAPLRFRRSRGFTLIEMMVVIAIIAILMAAIVAVGSSVRTSVLRRHTLAELKVLQGDMQDYLADGNTEPKPPTSLVPPQPWPYSIAGGQFARTNPESDLTNWVAALQSDPRYSKKLAGLPTDTDAGGVSSTAARPVILDAFGYPIRYIPAFTSSGITKQGYFMSAGPDGKFSTQCNNDGSPINYTSNPQPRADEIYSTDPQ